jgi:hypothetical protein
LHEESARRFARTLSLTLRVNAKIGARLSNTTPHLYGVDSRLHSTFDGQTHVQLVTTTSGEIGELNLVFTIAESTISQNKPAEGEVVPFEFGVSFHDSNTFRAQYNIRFRVEVQ